MILTDLSRIVGKRTKRRPGRPPRTQWEKQEQLYHRYWVLCPAARLARETARSAGWNYYQVHFWDALSGGWSWLREMGATVPLKLFYHRPPRTIAITCLVQQHGIRRSTARTYIKAAAQRHKDGICLLFGEECPALGGLASMPEYPDDPRWRALQRLWTTTPRLNFDGLALTDRKAPPS